MPERLKAGRSVYWSLVMLRNLAFVVGYAADPGAFDYRLSLGS